MSFMERAFTPPGTGAYVPPPGGDLTQLAPKVKPVDPLPNLPNLPDAPGSPPQFQTGKRQRSSEMRTTMLGEGVTSGQTGKVSLLGS